MQIKCIQTNFCAPAAGDRIQLFALRGFFWSVWCIKVIHMPDTFLSVQGLAVHDIKTSNINAQMLRER